MKFKLTRTSDWHFEDEIEIDTLEKLINFIEENGKQIVLFIEDDKLPEIEIYDAWRE